VVPTNTHFREEGQGDGSPGEEGARGVWEAGEEGMRRRIPKMVESGRNRERLFDIAQFFAIGKSKEAEATKIGWELGLKGTGGRKFPHPQLKCSTPIIHVSHNYMCTRFC